MKLFLFGLVLVLMSPVAFANDAIVSRQGRYLNLRSDVDDSDLLDDLVAAFDDAVPQWLAFWGVSIDRVQNWRVQGYLMRDQDAFRRAGYLPDRVPRIINGFASADAFWFVHQPSRYYNRHLVLHEGVHALAIELFGGGGPSWYMEGTAELLSTHRDRGVPIGEGPKLKVNDIPRTSDEAPYWGRCALIENHRRAGTLPTWNRVFELSEGLQADVNSYTWCWAAAMLLTNTPTTREGFIAAALNGRDQSSAFTSALQRKWQRDWPALQARWRLLLNELDYGFEWETFGAELSTNDPKYSGKTMKQSIGLRDGWKSAGYWFPAGTQLRVSATGQCHVLNGVPSGPSGITMRYHRGRPVGQLLVCVLPIRQDPDDAFCPPTEIRPLVGLIDGPAALASDRAGETTLRIDAPAWVLFKINHPPAGDVDSSSELGSYQVTF